jgi:hypothetical protein
MELDEVPVEEHQLQKHGGLEGGDHKAVTLKMDNSDYLKALVESMPRRLAKVIVCEGATAKK